MFPNEEELMQAFQSIERSDLTANTIICSTCGCLAKIKGKGPVCSHLKELGKFL